MLNLSGLLRLFGKTKEHTIFAAGKVEDCFLWKMLYGTGVRLLWRS